VVWIAERKDILSAFFGLWSILFYVRYVKRPTFRRFLPVILFFGLGLASKPMLVTLPFLLLLLDYWPLRRSFQNRRPLREKIPLFLLATLSSIVTFIVQRAGGAVATGADIPLGIRITNALVSYARYLGKTFLPLKLSILYPHPYFAFGHGWSPATAAGAALLLASITAICLWNLRTHPYLAVGWFWFIGLMVPVIGLVQVGTQAMADRYTYLPLIGLLIAIVWGVDSLRGQMKGAAVSIPLIALAVLAAGSILSARRIEDWRNSRTLYAQAVSVTTNNWEIYNNLGNVFLREGHFAKAIEQFRTVLKPGADSPALRAIDLGEVYYNLALAYWKDGRPNDAVRYNLRSLRLKPGNIDGWNNLGLAYAATGRIQDAIRAYERTLSVQPDDPAALFNLGLALLKDGNPGRAVDVFRSFLRYRPDYADAHRLLGEAYEAEGRINEAGQQYRTALRLNPKDHSARKKLHALEERDGDNR